MREIRLIKEGSPCDIDFTDKTIQSVLDVQKKEWVLCPNIEHCKNRNLKEVIQCYRLIAQKMANYILIRKLSFEQAVERERDEYIFCAPEGKFWVCRNGEWQVVQGKENVIEEIVDFALVIIDRQLGERLPFIETREVRKSPLNLSDVLYNVMIDLYNI